MKKLIIYISITHFLVFKNFQKIELELIEVINLELFNENLQV